MLRDRLIQDIWRESDAPSNMHDGIFLHAPCSRRHSILKKKSVHPNRKKALLGSVAAGGSSPSPNSSPHHSPLTMSLSTSAAATSCTDGLDPSVAYPQIGVGVNIFETTKLLTSALGTDGTSRMLFAPDNSLFSDPSCYQQYTNLDAENDYKLLEGSVAIATQVCA